MIVKLIERINELAKKQKNLGLTEEEKNEQAKLRRQYIEYIKTQVRTELEQVKKSRCSFHSHSNCECHNNK